MASTLNTSNSANRDSLLGPEMKHVDAMSRISGLDNHGVVGLQRQVMKEQDEGLEKLEETVISTKHIALAIGYEMVPAIPTQQNTPQEEGSRLPATTTGAPAGEQVVTLAKDELNRMIAEDVADRFVQPQVLSAVNLIVPKRKKC
ncbi:Syntaxin-51 [Striga hermonthica]|uniref:Syntaxin-51 n=1 Tax=Striga hermonthica TaxID=68872 RepID=A0A9N7NZH9_STRHE|nr:Syntaxin-51 [Striga hermonthica]